MRNRFVSGMIAGGIIGATTGMYAYKRMSPRQRRMVMRRGRKMLKGAANMVDVIQSINFLR
ncbi:YtxH domain-containing protein [Crassaminicella indica]|uniref:YtxH domain-containing protein n=1 Tax=Crassaminicella indica TaxID=2855394 RepID=A0ABX8RAC4_9CLOT|nr:YtxH domain-containing protein [Crassaminicella indica]QXM05973.1 YtxH domain-containing protein [Crassaminicella indica]